MYLGYGRRSYTVLYIPVTVPLLNTARLPPRMSCIRFDDDFEDDYEDGERPEEGEEEEEVDVEEEEEEDNDDVDLDNEGDDDLGDDDDDGQEEVEGEGEGGGALAGDGVAPMKKVASPSGLDAFADPLDGDGDLDEEEAEAGRGGPRPASGLFPARTGSSGGAGFASDDGDEFHSFGEEAEASSQFQVDVEEVESWEKEQVGAHFGDRGC